MTHLHRPRTPLFLRDQMGHFDDLDHRHCQAVDDVWADYGLDAARVFCFGA